MQDLLACIIRVCNTAGETLGTGFVVTENLVVTCAHVVAACGSAPGGYVRVVFHANGQVREAEVLADFWSAPDADDIAVLHLFPHNQLLPHGVVPVILGSTRACNGHPMRTMGFPELPGGYDVAWAEGQLRGVVSHPGKQSMLQMDARPILKGMSGAPVLDLDTQRVVGIVSEFMPNAPLEWATTADALKAVCPDLQLHPPQVVEEYLTAVREYCANLPYLSLYDIRPARILDEVYVPLKARPQRNADERESQDEERVLHDRSLSITEVLKNSDYLHLLILGEPGAGKSTLLRQLAEQAWSAPQKIGLTTPYLPLLVPLRRLALAEGSLEERLNRALTNEMALRREPPSGFFDEWTQQTNVHWLVLLDGLDEVPADQRADLVQRLKSFPKAIGPNRIVITTRPSGYVRGELDEKQFGHYELLSFTPEQTDKFALKWCDDKASDFLKELKSVRIGNLRGTPLLLTIAAKVYLELGELPERRTLLYGQFTHVWLSEAGQRGLMDELGEKLAGPIDLQIRRLSHLALRMTEQTHDTTFESLRGFVAEHLQTNEGFNRTHAESYSGEFIRIMARRSGVFTRRGEIFDFFHPTFREYLAAASVVWECGQDLEQIWERIVSRWMETKWREVALFVLGLLSGSDIDISSQLGRIWQTSDDGLLFAGVALIEQANVNIDLSNSIIDKLLVRASGISSLATFAFLNPIEILAGLSSQPRSTDGLLMLVRNKKVWSQVRIRVARVLGHQGFTDVVVPILLELADEKNSLVAERAGCRNIG